MKMKVVGALAVLALSLTLWACPSTGGLNRGKQVTDADLALGFSQQSNRDASMFSETLRMQATLDGGGAMYMRLLVSNVGPADHKAAFRLNVSIPGKPLRQLSLWRKRGKWTTGADKLDVKLGKLVTIEGSVGEMKVRFDHPSALIEFNVATDMAPLRPAGGNADFGNGRFYSTVVHIPYGELEGSVAFKGKDGAVLETVALKGVAYVENRGTNVAPHTLQRRQMTAIAITRAGTFCAVAMEKTTQLGGGYQAWLYATEGDKMRVVMQEATLQLQKPVRDEGSGYLVPQLVKFTEKAPPEGRAAAQAVIHGQTLTERIDDLAQLSRIERFFVERLAKPWSFRFDGKYLLAIPKAEGGDERVRGKTTYVFQQLN